MESTTPPVGDQPLPPAAAGPRPDGGVRDDGGFFDSVRRVGLVRTQDRWIGGVSGGLARRFGIDPLLVRGLFGVTALLGGAGLVVYGVAWALLPEEADGRIHLQETVQGRFDAAILGALAFVLVGANRGTGWDGWWDDGGFGWVDGLLWLAAIGAVIAILVSAGNQRGRNRAAGLPVDTWSAAPPPPPGAAPRAPHPGYGAVPLAQPAPAGPTWAAPAPGATSPVPPPPSGVAGSGGYTAYTGSGGASGYGGYGGTGGPVGPVAGAAPTSDTPAGWGGSGATALRAPQPAAPVPPPAPSRPLKPRVLGPGVGMVGTVVGLTLVALAALLVVDREGELGQPVLLTALGIGIVLAGLGILVSGLRGRRSGTLGFLAILGLVAAVPLAAVPHSEAEWGLLVGDGDRTGVATGQVWRPDTVADARRGLQVGVGDVNVDLTGVPLDDGQVVEVPIRMGAGDLEVVVPEDVAVTGEISLNAGQIQWDVDGNSQVAGFTGGRAELYESDEVADGDAVELAVRINAGAGDVRVVEEDR